MILIAINTAIGIIRISIINTQTQISNLNSLDSECVIIEENDHIYNFPFIFGSHTYLKNIKTNEKKAIMNSYLPFLNFKSLISYSDQDMLYEFGDEEIHYEYRYVNFKDCKNIEVKFPYAIVESIVYNGKIYYCYNIFGSPEKTKIEETAKNTVCEGIYIKDISTNKDSQYYKNYISLLKRIDHYISYYDYQKKSIVVDDLESDESMLIKCDSDQYNIFYNKEHDSICVLKSDIMEEYEFGIENPTNSFELDKFPYEIAEAEAIKGDKIYMCTFRYNVKSYDYKKQEYDTIIYAKQVFKNTEDLVTYVTFYENYIVYEYDKNKIYDYQGNLLN